MKLPGPKLTECFNPKFGYVVGAHESGLPKYRVRSFYKTEEGRVEREYFTKHIPPDVVFGCRGCALVRRCVAVCGRCV